MIRILICCLGGFSSSAMVKKIKDEIIRDNLKDKLSVEFYPFSNAYKIIENFDIVMVCPHTRYDVQIFLKKHDDINILIYVLPPRMYGQMNAKELYIDAEDIIDGYKKDRMNPWHFQDEEDIMMVTRNCSHRNSLK